MGVLMLAAAQGARVKVRCEGEDANRCLSEIAVLIANKFGEDQ
jgi:phosphocarrier protein